MFYINNFKIKLLLGIIFTYSQATFQLKYLHNSEREIDGKYVLYVIVLLCIVLYCTILYCALLYFILLYYVVLCCVRYSTIQYNTIPCHTIPHNTVQCNSMQYNTQYKKYIIYPYWTENTISYFCWLTTGKNV